ncbi:MAG TPA: carboxypeptidase-like regulatory domain-containing protein [Bryobacteraceae bacterium]|nr:carboxypeptidase-like regulatory domain-containing protein [Bryobacteraceae bacterium]
MTRRLLLALVPACALPGWADDDDKMTKLRVEVQTLSGKPIERASVLVKFVKGRSVLKLGKKQITNWQLRTNQAGFVNVPAIPQGDIQVRVIAKGYQTFGETFEINEPEKTLTIKLNPPQPQYSAHQ